MAPFRVWFTSYNFTFLFLCALLQRLAQGALKAASEPLVLSNSTSATNYTLTFYNNPDDSINNDQLQVTFVFAASYLLNQDQAYVNFLLGLALLSGYPYLGRIREIDVPALPPRSPFASSFRSEDILHPKLTPRACGFAVWTASTYFRERPGLLHPFTATIKDGETVLGEWAVGVRVGTKVASSSKSASSMRPSTVPSIRTTAALGRAISDSQALTTAAASSDKVSLRDISSSAASNHTSLGFPSAGLGIYGWSIFPLFRGIPPLYMLMTFIQTLVQLLPYSPARVVSGLAVRSMFYETELKFIKLATLPFSRAAAIEAIRQMLAFAVVSDRWAEMDALLVLKGNILFKVTLRRGGNAE
ncbi:MAG: hypothetical protein Q9167_000809 [Letrouitia subvulpina]